MLLGGSWGGLLGIHAQPSLKVTPRSGFQIWLCLSRSETSPAAPQWESHRSKAAHPDSASMEGSVRFSLPGTLRTGGRVGITMAPPRSTHYLPFITGHEVISLFQPEGSISRKSRVISRGTRIGVKCPDHPLQPGISDKGLLADGSEWSQ